MPGENLDAGLAVPLAQPHVVGGALIAERRGKLAALRGQGFDAHDAAVAGALLHAAAGDAAAREDGERGLLPSDLLPWLRRLANPVRR